MAVLKTALTVTLGLIGAGAHAVTDSQDGELMEPAPSPTTAVAVDPASLCGSTAEFIATLKFIRENKEITINEADARRIAEKVSRGCDGGAARFAQTFNLLRAVGVSEAKSLEFATQFSGYPTATQKNFVEIFSKAFLGEFFDYDFATAVRLALDLSRDYHGDPAKVRDDFIDLARFCRDSKSIDLPAPVCAEYAVKMARLSESFPNGVREPFKSFYRRLREGEDFGLDVRTALDVAYNVLKHGPRAVDNFLTGYAFAMSDDGLSLTRQPATEFALRMASRSFAGDKPPILRDVSSAKRR